MADKKLPGVAVRRPRSPKFAFAGANAVGGGGTPIATRQPPMNIRFISSLDADDELRFAKAAVAALSVLLDECSMAYTLRIETAGGKVIEHLHIAHAPDSPEEPATNLEH